MEHLLGWMSNLGPFYSLSLLPSFTYILCNNFEIVCGITCCCGVQAIQTMFIGNSALKDSYGTYTLVVAKDQAIVNTTYQSMRTKGVHLWKVSSTIGADTSEDAHSGAALQSPRTAQQKEAED